MGKQKITDLDMSEFEGPEGMKKLLKLAQDQIQQQKQNGHEDEGEKDEDIDDEEEDNGPREGCSLAYDALNVKLITSENDMSPLFNQRMLFKPEYVHQIYGQEEEIEGYEGLQINIFMLSGSLNSLVEFTYEKKMPGAPDCLQPLRENCLIEGFALKRKEFAKLVKDEKDFKPFGIKLREYTVEVKTNSTKKSTEAQQYEVWAVSTAMQGVNGEQFTSYKRRLQSFVKFFIEVGSFVDESDEWEYLITYQINKNGQYIFAGAVNRYEFNLSATKCRHRLSQIFILPPFQRQGHATQLFKCLYDRAQQESRCLELTVEDASEGLQLARDILQAQMLIEGQYFEWMKAVNSQSIRSVFGLSGLTISKEQFIKNKLKMPLHEIRRVYEILVLSKIDRNSQEVNDRFRGMCLQYLKDQQEIRQLKRKIPYIIFEGKPLKVDLQSVLEQKKQLEPNDQYYLETFNANKQQYLQVINKLKI